MWVWSLVQEDLLGKGMANHSSILAWRIPWTKEPGGLHPMGLQRVEHDWATNTFILIPELGYQFRSVQLLSYVQLFATPWAAACQSSLSITNSWSLLKLMSIESVMPSNHLILCHPLLLSPSIVPSIRAFQMSRFFTSGSQSIGVSASASVLPMNIQDRFPLG